MSFISKRAIVGAVLGISAVFAALTWVTIHTLQLERSEKETAALARHQEVVRLVLWRMDSALTPIIAREAARPYFEYQSFYPADITFARPATPPVSMAQGEKALGDALGALVLPDPANESEPKSGFDVNTEVQDSANSPPVRGVLVPSPLLAPELTFINVYFQIDEFGAITSPQAPTGRQREWADSAYTTNYDLLNAQDKLERIASIVGASAPGQSVRARPSDVRSQVNSRDDSETPVNVSAPRPTIAAGSVASASVNVSPALPAPTSKSQAAMPAIALRSDMHETYEQRKDVAEKEQIKQGTRLAMEVADNPQGSLDQSNAPIQAPAGPAEAVKKSYGEYQARQLATQAANQVDDTRVRNKSSATKKENVSATQSALNQLQEGANTSSPANVTAGEAQSFARPEGSLSARPPQQKFDESAGKEGSPPPPLADAAPSALAAKPDRLAATDSSGTSAGASRWQTSPDDVTKYGRAATFPAASTAVDEREAVTQGQFAARWILRDREQTPELLFERNITIGDKSFTQGIWLNWPQLKSILLATAADLLPGSDLKPILDPASLTGDQLALGQALAAIPAQLVAPVFPAPTLLANGTNGEGGGGGGGSGGWSPAKTTLTFMWASVLGAMIVAAAALISAIELAQRRGRFVSAVTHELRTPLTTFCLYSQMLADGMVQDPDARTTYLLTLKDQSQRLARIVESVLDYARLSGKRSTIITSEITITDLLHVLRRPLVARCEQANMQLVIDDFTLPRQRIATDAAVVERVIFNLVDNACKYAADAADKRIILSLALSQNSLRFTVRDFGEGVNSKTADRLFRAFTRGEAHATGAIPGLGLGLAIARGLAQQLGGSLVLDPPGPTAVVTHENAAQPVMDANIITPQYSAAGASFTLRLPMA